MWCSSRQKDCASPAEPDAQRLLPRTSAPPMFVEQQFLISLFRAAASCKHCVWRESVSHRSVGYVQRCARRHESKVCSYSLIEPRAIETLKVTGTLRIGKLNLARFVGDGAQVRPILQVRGKLDGILVASGSSEREQRAAPRL